MMRLIVSVPDLDIQRCVLQIKKQIKKGFEDYMITIIRWFILKSKEIKMKLAVMSFLEQIVNEVVNNSNDIQKKIIDSVVKNIHESNNEQNKKMAK